MGLFGFGEKKEAQGGRKPPVTSIKVGTGDEEVGLEEGMYQMGKGAQSIAAARIGEALAPIIDLLDRGIISPGTAKEKVATVLTMLDGRPTNEYQIIQHRRRQQMAQAQWQAMNIFQKAPVIVKEKIQEGVDGFKKIVTFNAMDPRRDSARARLARRRR